MAADDPETKELIMCFADIGRITAVDGASVRVATDDGTIEASLTVLAASGRTVALGDWVLVSLGLVLERLDEEAGRALCDERRAVHEGDQIDAR